MACDNSPSTAGNDFERVALRRPEIRHGGLADDAQVTLAEFRRGHFVVHQPAADDDDARIEQPSPGSPRGSPSRAPENRKSPAPARRPFARGCGATKLFPSSARWIWRVRGREIFSIFPPADAAGRRWSCKASTQPQFLPQPQGNGGPPRPNRCSGAAMWAVSMAVSVWPVSGRPSCAHERAAEAGAGHEHQDRQLVVGARDPRLGHAAAMAVVAHRQRQRRGRPAWPAPRCNPHEHPSPRNPPADSASCRARRNARYGPGIARPTPWTCGHCKLFCARNSPMPAIQPAMTASRPFCALVGRWRILVVTASPFSRTAANLEVVAPLSVPMKIFSLMICAVKLRTAPAKARIIRLSPFNPV